jgi:hypothetical protein
VTGRPPPAGLRPQHPPNIFGGINMNGADCGKCGYIQCRCREIELEKQGNSIYMEQFEKDTNELYLALIKPKGLRLKLLRWLYPEVVKVSDSLRRCYWS